MSNRGKPRFPSVTSPSLRCIVWPLILKPLQRDNTLNRSTEPALDPLPDGDPPSKTKRKQAMLELQALGKRLVELSPGQVNSVPMPEDLRDAIREKQRIAPSKHEGQRRQLQYIGRLMRELDPTPIREWLARLDGQSAQATHELHVTERWRERLLADDAALTDFTRAYPPADLQALRAAIREARREQVSATADAAAGRVRPPKHFRELFRLIRVAMKSKESAEPTLQEAPADD